MSKKLALFIFASLLFICCIPVLSNDNETEIFCDMNAIAQRGIYAKEDITSNTFIINDVYKTLYLQEAGTRAAMQGYISVFNNSEISIKEIPYGKNTKIDVYINRKSGSISMRRIETNIWFGDIITDYKGYCRKTESQLF